MEWKLEEFFANSEIFDSFIKEISDKSLKFNRNFKGNLNSLSNSEFLASLREFESLNERISKAMSYAHLSFAKDTTTGANLAKIEQICNEISENLLFFELEFNELDEAKQDEFIEFCVDYRYYLELLKKQKSHQLTFLEERILLKTSPISSEAFSRLFDESMARLRFKFRDKTLKEEEILSLLHSEDREIRREAALALSEVLGANSHLLTYIYNMIKTDLKISCDLRNYESGEMIMHEYNRIEKQSVDALIRACEGSFEICEKFYEKKREILGFEELYDYDRYAPLKGGDENFSFEEAKSIVLAAFGNFCPEFEEMARVAFENSWIDVYPSENKQSGAFSHSASSDTHPFVLLNFTEKRRDIFTLAHELGHAIHQKLAYKVGYFGSHTPLTTAETASVFCEMIVFDYLKNLSNNDSKKAMLASKIEDIFATFYRQINFTTFERRIHAYDGEISSEKIGEIWLEESKKMFGKGLKLNEYYSLWWSYIPHFIHSPFYCYSYSYAQLFVLALYGLYKSGKCENFVKKYTEFLTLGGSKSPKDMMKIFDLDIDDSGFWEIGIDEIRKMVEEFRCMSF